MTEEEINRLADELARRLGAARREKLLTRIELAEALGVHPTHVYKLVRRGQLPDGYPVGKVRRWDYDAVKKFLAGRKVPRRRRRRSAPKPDAEGESQGLAPEPAAEPEPPGTDPGGAGGQG